MADTTTSMTQDFAPGNATVQSPLTSTDDIPSSVYLHATCRKCNHWFNKQKVPYPFPNDGSFDVECPKCHTKLLRVGTQSSQETFMTQATNSRPSSMDLASIESVIRGDPGPPMRFRPSLHLSRTRTEPAQITPAAPPNPRQSLANQTMRGAVPPQDQNLFSDIAATDTYAVHPARQDQDDTHATSPENTLLTSTLSLPGVHAPSFENFYLHTPGERKIIKNKSSRISRKTSGIRRRIATFLKTKVFALATTRRPIRPKAVVAEPPNVDSGDTELDGNPPDSFATDVATQVETHAQNSSPTAEATTQTDYRYLTPPDHATEIARVRARSAPPVPPTASQGIQDIANLKDERRKLTREEKTRKAQQKMLESRRCPCWPLCDCYSQESNRQIQRVHTLPRRLTDIPSLRDDLRMDDFYREIQHLARRARAQREERPGSILSQRGHTSSQAPSQDGTPWSSLATTLSSNNESGGLAAFTQPDGFHQDSSYAQAIGVNTDMATETLADEDQNATPRPHDQTTRVNGIHAESPDADLLGIGGVYDDSNHFNTDEANQRN